MSDQLDALSKRPLIAASLPRRRTDPILRAPSLSPCWPWQHASTRAASRSIASTTRAATACDDATPNDCSLRGATLVANGLNEPSIITIPAGHYVLSASSFCRLQPSADPNFDFSGDGPALCVSRDLTFVGAGAAETILDANEPAGTTGAGHPLFLVSWGVTSRMEGLTLTKGNWTAGSPLFPGGGLYNAGTLTLVDAAVNDNYGGYAGGISNRGTLTLQRCLLTRNTGYGGAAVYNSNGGTVTAYETEASFNTASNIGGAFNNAGGTMTIVNSSLHDNVARNAGAIGADLFTTTTVINTTISGNQAFDAGGISSSGTMTLRSCTVTANTAQWTTDPGRGSGGGIQGALTVSNSILAGNFSAAGKPDCNASLTSEGHNLIGNTNGCAISGPQTGDVTGVGAAWRARVQRGCGADTCRSGQPGHRRSDPAAPGSGDPACPAADQRGAALAGRPVTSVPSGLGGLRPLARLRARAPAAVLLHVAGNGFEPGATVRLRAGRLRSMVRPFMSRPADRR
jgi:hypothetical protein